MTSQRAAARPAGLRLDRHARGDSRADAGEDAAEREAALRDAAMIAERIDADEAAAAVAREEYRSRGLPRLVLDSALADLAADEHLHAHRPEALLELSSAAGVLSEPSSGPLWLTSRRLAHGGRTLTSVLLTEIDEMAVAVGRLLLIRLRDGSGVAIESDQPRLLRVQLAAAMEAGRRADA